MIVVLNFAVNCNDCVPCGKYVLPKDYILYLVILEHIVSQKNFKIPFFDVLFAENGPRINASVYRTDCPGVKGGNPRATDSNRSLKDHSIGSGLKEKRK